MKKLILPTAMVLAFALFSSCKDKKTKDIEKMHLTVNKLLDDHLFKENIKATLREISFLKVDTLNQNTLDTIRKAGNTEKMTKFLDKINELKPLITSDLNQMTLQKNLGWTDLFNNTKIQFDEHQNEMRKLIDSVEFYQKINEKISARIAKNKKPKPTYQLKSFFKLTLTKNNKSENILDTVYNHFDENINLIKM